MLRLLSRRVPSDTCCVETFDWINYRLGDGEGVFETWALRCEHLAAVFGDVPVVFEADAELAGDVDAGFVGETHSECERRGVATDEVGPFVAVHADAVADAVGEVFVVGTEAGGGDDVASGCVDGLARYARVSRGKSRGLGLVNDVEDFACLVEFGCGCVAEDEGAGDVGLIAFYCATVVDKDDLAFANDLGLQRAVGERGVFADLAACIADDAAAGVSEVDELRELAGSHAGLHGFVGGFVDGEGDVVSELHEGEFGSGFDAAAAEGDGSSAGGGEGRARVGDAVGEDELGALFDADLSCGDTGFFEGFGEEFVGVVVFVPCVDACGGGRGKGSGFGFHALADAALFEDRADDKGVSFCGECPSEEAFGLAPAEAGEISERGACGDDGGVDFVLLHEGAGAVEALLAFGQGDGDGFIAAVGEGGDRGRELGFGGRRRGGSLGFESEGRGCSGCGGGQEKASSCRHVRIVTCRLEDDAAVCRGTLSVR